jgi:hypothetical protein
VCSSAYYQLKKIAKIRKYITHAAAAQLVSALVKSRIDYGNSLLTGLPSSRLYPLQKAQYAAARIVNGARRRDPITRHLKDLNLLPISYFIDLKIAVLVWRCLNGCALYLSSLLNRRNLDRRSLRSSSAPSALYALCTPSTRIKSYGRRAFSNYAPTLWNNLPVSIRSSLTIQIFRSTLKTRLFREDFNN